MSVNNSRIIADYLNEVREQIIKAHLAAGQRASGRTLESFEVSASDFTGQLLGKDFVGVLETGRRAGKIPQGFKGIILQWMKDKGIYQDADEKAQGRIAYFIAQKIKREGTKLSREGAKSGVLSQALDDKNLEGLLQAIASKYQSALAADLAENYNKSINDYRGVF